MVDGDGILGESIVLLGTTTLLLLVDVTGDGSAAAMVLRPHQGMAIVEFCDEKVSYDELVLGFVKVLLGLM